ncbi:MAG: glycosyltransferase family 39 protein [Acidobacteria bacterium]|nr:glycosyltransferase family 39 protein [Acidobacteriota bacterium]
MTEREWREASDIKPSALALVLVVAIGFALRVWNIGSGVPFAVGIDEPAIMSTVVRILKSGDFNPHFFEYPTGVVYFQLGVAVVQFLHGAMRHAWYAVEQVGMADFYLWGRIATATLGTATILLLHQVGMRWGARHALLAAGLFAVMPLQVREAHFALTDTPLVFCVTLTLLLSLRALEKPTTLAFVLAGAAAGLSAGVKYNGLYAAILPLTAALMAQATRQRSLTNVVLVAGSSVAAFFVTTPYAILDLPNFLNGFGTQTRAFVPRQPGGKSTAVIYAEHLVANLGWPAFLLAIAGLVLSVVRMFRGPVHARWVMLVAFPVLFFNLITGWSFLFARYALPIVPFMCLWAAIATISGVSLLRRFDIPRVVRTTLIVGLTVAALLPPSVKSVRWVRGFGTKTTQALAYQWLTHNVWFQSKVVSEARGLDLPPERYKFTAVRSLADRDPATFLADGTEWIVLSSDAWGGSAQAGGVRPAPAAYAGLEAGSTEVKVIEPTPANPGPVIRIRKVSR